MAAPVEKRGEEIDERSDTISSAITLNGGVQRGRQRGRRRGARVATLCGLAALLLSSCDSSAADVGGSNERQPVTAVDNAQPSASQRDPAPDTGPVSAVASSTTTTTTTTVPPATVPPTTASPAITVPPATTVTLITVPPTTTTVPPTTSTVPSTTPYVVPVVDVAAAGWGTTHSSYAATDIFSGCGSPVVSPVNATVLEVRRVDLWSAEVDNPATRGGRSIAVLGDDGVRYYMAHFDVITASLAPGGRVAAGQPVGTMGTTGRSSACHLHFSISPPCPGKEWAVRRGVVWPYPYLDAWARGEHLSPVAEVSAWSAANADACALAMTDPFAADS